MKYMYIMQKFVSDLWQVGGFLGEITLDGLIILDIQLLTRPPVYIITYKIKEKMCKSSLIEFIAKVIKM
jgi:hypothetical protein